MKDRQIDYSIEDHSNPSGQPYPEDASKDPSKVRKALPHIHYTGRVALKNQETGLINPGQGLRFATTGMTLLCDLPSTIGQTVEVIMLNGSVSMRGKITHGMTDGELRNVYGVVFDLDQTELYHVIREMQQQGVI